MKKWSDLGGAGKIWRVTWACIAAFVVIVVLVVVSVIFKAPEGNFKKTEKAEFPIAITDQLTAVSALSPEKWPLTITTVNVGCEKWKRVYVVPLEGEYVGIKFGVNGTGKGVFRDVKPIWRTDQKLVDEIVAAGSSIEKMGYAPRVSITPLITLGLALCEADYNGSVAVRYLKPLE